jgi:hypothetical protein
MTNGGYSLSSVEGSYNNYSKYASALPSCSSANLGQVISLGSTKTADSFALCAYTKNGGADPYPTDPNIYNSQRGLLKSTVFRDSQTYPATSASVCSRGWSYDASSKVCYFGDTPGNVSALAWEPSKVVPTYGGVSSGASVATSTPSCGAGQILVGSSCQIYCASGTVPSSDGKSCVQQCDTGYALVGGSCQAYCTGDSILSADGKSCVIPTCSVTLTRVTQSGSPSTGGNTIVEKVLTTLLSSNSYTIEKLKATFENVTNLQYSFNRLAFKDWKASNGLNDFPNGSETYTSGTDSTYVFRGVSKNGSTTKTVLCSPDTVIIKAPPETAPYDNTAPGGGGDGPGGM